MTFRDITFSSESQVGEVLYRTEKTIVTRIPNTESGSQIILKQAFGLHAIQRLHHEISILSRLVDIEGTPKVVHTHTSASTLALRDDGCIPLSELLKHRKLNHIEVISLTIDLANIIASIHRVGVIHKDINPSNVLVSIPALKPTLIDFGIASIVAEEHPGFMHQNQIAGTLHYMAPEQTGRTGRSVDHRVDLYALGILLYALTVGRTPFEGNDLLDIVHDHLVRTPTPPSQLARDTPLVLSHLIMRLLEKEPDHRYQSAEGVVYDLKRICDALAHGECAPFPLAEHDFARRLSPPSRLIGRDDEIATLRLSIDQAIQARTRCLFVAGNPGVGKSALINELRSMVTARRGWFVSSKFDQYQQGVPKAVTETMRALGRLLLAESEDQLALDREKIIKGLGSNLGHGPSLLPEFQLMLGKTARIEVTDPREAEARIIRSSIDLLRSVASRTRPLVMVLDDVQWAPSMSLRFIDAIISEHEEIPGLLLVCAYRSKEVDAAHPLSALFANWNLLGLKLPFIKLENLPQSDISMLIGEMLRLAPADAKNLAIAINERTDGNPYDTVELINALRQDGLLVQCDGTWKWDRSTIRQYIGISGIVDILGRRIAKLPDGARDVLENMACLGGEIETELLALACGLEIEALSLNLAPSLEDGLIVTESNGVPIIRFRHDRVQQAVVEHMDHDKRIQRHLLLARRLTKIFDHKNLAAAEQYLFAVDAITDVTERRTAVGLFERAANCSGALNYVITERFLSAAIKLLQPIASSDDEGLLTQLDIALHTTLYCLGRPEEADKVYDAIVARCISPIDLVEPTGIQMFTLINRTLYRQAMELGLNLLAELGLNKPQDTRPTIEAGLTRITQWYRSEEKRLDFTRPEVNDPIVLAWATLLGKTTHAAFFCDQSVCEWVNIEATRLWIEHGPCSQLLAPGVIVILYLLVRELRDYEGAFVLGRHLLDVGEARGYQQTTSMARAYYSIAAGHWIDPIESVLADFQKARAGLAQAGIVAFAEYAYTFVAVDLYIDSGATLEAATVELDTGMAFADRTGNTPFRLRYTPRRQLIRSLQGETKAPGIFSDENFDESSFVEKVGAKSTNAASYHIWRAVSAAIFGDSATLQAQTEQAMPLLNLMSGYYITVIARVMRALALAVAAHKLPFEDRKSILIELDSTCLQWLTLRATDSPMNFLHLQRWIEAEHAWVASDIWTAGAAFDLAMNEAALHPRPWHRALIIERAALFHLEQGMEQSAQSLFVQACALYEAWGASAKVSEMHREHIFLRTTKNLWHTKEGTNSTILGNDMIDMLAVLRASQALSSETSLLSLTVRLGKVLGDITGATNVHLLVRTDDQQNWCLAESLSDDTAAVLVEQAAEQGELSISVFRYVERTRETLVLEDAVHDDRFLNDPYFSGLAHCSMLCAPIFSHAELRAILILESHVRRSAFTAERMDAIMLIAGQMSVSLDNALLYASLERKVAERTAALEEANRQLEQLSRTDALTGLANRRSFNETLEEEYQRAKRLKTPLGLAIVDIDFFKLYNDHYGHQGGDACLELVSRTLATGRRGGSDLVARYGGEEFVILLPNTDLEGARIVAERVRSAVEELQVPHSISLIGFVTISIGISSFVPTHETKPELWVELADAALYEAKRDGRNRVAIAKYPCEQVSAGALTGIKPVA